MRTYPTVAVSECAAQSIQRLRFASSGLTPAIRFPKQPPHGNLQAARDGSNLVIHQVARSVLDAGDSATINVDVLRGQAACQIFLTDCRRTFQAGRQVVLRANIFDKALITRSTAISRQKTLQKR